MFMLTLNTEKDEEIAMSILKRHCASFYVFGNIDNKTSLVVDVGLTDDGLDLCELEFQMNFHQTGQLYCPLCKSQGKEYCGHLVFSSYIDR